MKDGCHLRLKRKGKIHVIAWNFVGLRICCSSNHLIGKKVNFVLLDN